MLKSLVSDYDKPLSTDVSAGLPSVLENRVDLLKKVLMPIFDGTLPFSWIAQVERFFCLGKYLKEDKLGSVSLCLEGDLLNWFNWQMDRNTFSDWLQFKRRLLTRFGVSMNVEPVQRLFSLKKWGSVTDFVNEFEELCTLMLGLDDEYLEHIFYKGLKPEMKEVIKLKETQSLANYIVAVLKMETSVFCKVVGDGSQGEVNPPQYNSSRPVSHYNSQRTVNTVSFNINVKQRLETLDKGSSRPFQRSRQSFTDAELDEKWRKGLCFKCDGRYSSTHVCPNKELHVLTVMNGYEMKVFDEKYY